MAKQINEISSNLYKRALDKARQDKANATNIDKFGNELDNKNRVYADRLRQGDQNLKYLDSKEMEENPMAQQAKSIWAGNNLESQIEWGDNEFAGDETYGPCTGFVNYVDGETGEKWEFEVEGSVEYGSTPSIESNTVDFTAPDGSRGYFYINEVPTGDKVNPVDDKYLNEMKSLMERMDRLGRGSILL